LPRHDLPEFYQSSPSKEQGRRECRVFGAPLGIAIASCFGFAAAFLFGGIGQWMSWAGLGLPIAVILWVMVRAWL
jgi:hypothetical protein